MKSVTGIINHKFISFSAVQIYDLSYIYLHSSLSTGILRTYNVTSSDGIWPMDTENVAETLFTNVCSLESRALVRRQVSDPIRIKYLQLCREGQGHTYYAAKVSEVVCLLYIFAPSMERVAISSLNSDFSCHHSIDLKSYSCKCTLECHNLPLHVLKFVTWVTKAIV